MCSVVPARVCVSWKRCVCLVVTGGDRGSPCFHRLEAVEPEHNSLFSALIALPSSTNGVNVDWECWLYGTVQGLFISHVRDTYQVG